MELEEHFSLIDEFKIENDMLRRLMMKVKKTVEFEICKHIKIETEVLKYKEGVVLK